MKTTQSLPQILAVLVASVCTASATITLDLTAPLSNGFINGAFYTTTDLGSTGSGVIKSFVRVQDNGVADGYNASARPVMPDVNNSHTFTHDLLLSAVPVVSVSGISYYEFLLDINQQNSNPLLSLDKIQIYTRSTALATANTLAALSGSSTLRYDLDDIDGSGPVPASDNGIKLNYSLNSGSGYGDMFAYIPVSRFGATTDFVYFYSSFGADFTENDGFEEWAVRSPGGTTTTGNVPDGGGTLALLGLALSALGITRRRSNSKA